MQDRDESNAEGYTDTPTDKAAALKEWIGYLMGDGQKMLADIGYATVPDATLQKGQAQLSQITG